MKKILALIAIVFIGSYTQAQTRVITTGVPFLLVAGDARAAGMGDNGVATAPDVFSQQWNPSKYAFSIDKQGFSVGYTPYLVELVNDISLSQVTYFNKYSDRAAFAGSIRYFSLGEIELRQNIDDTPVVVKPAEYAIDLSYALKLSDYFSMSVGGRFIRSNLRIPTEGSSSAAANSFAFDVSGYHQSEEMAFNSFNGKLRWGFNFQNLGPKINYDKAAGDEGSNFLPANMKLGAGFDFILDDYNKVAVGLEVNKLLVPTPIDPEDVNGDGDFDDPEDLTQREANEEYDKIGWVSGIFKSFNDAPDGMSEELKEFTYSVGAEYLYQDSFAFRLGYFNESPDKGARRFFSLGAGFKYNVIKVDVSYLFSASKVKNPLENTLRFSLSFAFGDKYDEY
ncbi:type IX secretion system outer membrane channel protein PorV [Flavobacterium sp. CYK-4]|uniref:type IX secretion system outer membrane channel protein PorV n=1 Tax=Flavobacterium lotistagni TaxID=2709660 RepID=UPI001407F89B|nr:type IX secretion system outer membrane channel protein PorV [Flavobacterium lotistagni]NHM08195.1 type IX secretion system outer membrane channel protein PorV [Flavobacterium lotistagni]